MLIFHREFYGTAVHVEVPSFEEKLYPCGVVEERKRGALNCASVGSSSPRSINGSSSDRPRCDDSVSILRILCNAVLRQTRASGFGCTNALLRVEAWPLKRSRWAKGAVRFDHTRHLRKKTRSRNRHHLSPASDWDHGALAAAVGASASRRVLAFFFVQHVSPAG